MFTNYIVFLTYILSYRDREPLYARTREGPRSLKTEKSVNISVKRWYH